MIVPDLNLLIYVYNQEAPLHDSARSWWERLLNGTEPVGVPWVVVTGFIRLLTRPSVLSRPATPQQAVTEVERWFQLPHVSPLLPGPEHLQHLRATLGVAGAGTNLVTDAHVAALAIEHDAELHSNDKDFARFPGLRWRNPL